MTEPVQRLVAAAKINLSLVVGPRRDDGLHEIATVMQRVDLCDALELEPAPELTVVGFEADTLVRSALERLAHSAGVEPRWRVRLTKAIPPASGLGGGSADAAGALVLANRTLGSPFSVQQLREIGGEVGSDVPFFLDAGPKLVTGAGELLERVELPQDFWVVIVLARDAAKHSTGAVYRRFDELDGQEGFEERRRALLAALDSCRRPLDLAALPKNDLAPAAGGSGLARDLLAAGAFRADLSGAGPAAYGLFQRRREARRAASRLGSGVRSWLVAPVW